MTSRSALALAVMLLAACPEPGDPICSTGQLGGGAYVRLGHEVTVRAGISVSCFIPNQPNVDRPLREVKEVEIEVLDPDNKRVTATATAPERSGGKTIFEVTTNVTFLLDKPGPYTVIARFEPNVGRSQQLVRALTVRLDAGFRELPVALPSECKEYGLTASGTPLCVFPAPNTLGDSTLAIGSQRLDGASFAIDGDAIWLLGPRSGGLGPRVERFERTDAGTWGLAQRLVLSGASQSGSQFAAGGGQGYLYAQNFGMGLERVVPDGDAGFVRSTVSIGNGRVPLAVSSGTDVTLVLANGNTGAPVVLSLFPDGGSQVVSAGSQFVQRWMEEDGVLWLGRTDFTSTGSGQLGTAVAIDARDGTIRSTSVGFLANPSGFLPAALSPQAPVVRVKGESDESWVVVPVLGGPDLELESFVAGPGYSEVVSATSRHAFARSLDGKTLKIIDR